jgi:hypothetical protein
MRVILDDQPCNSAATSVAQAVADAAASVETRGRVIVEVLVDGAALTEEDLGSEELQSRDADEVAMVSADLKELVDGTLTHASEALVEADHLQRHAAERLQSDDRVAAMASLNDALSIWLAVHEAVMKSAAALDIDVDRLPVHGQSMEKRIERLNEHLRAIQSALQGDDPVALSDTLLYELPEVVNQWREVLDVMRSTLEDQVR